jgi:hypothetical protein
MISPHLLHVVESFSTSNQLYRTVSAAKGCAFSLWKEYDPPIFVIETKNKEPRPSQWCHMILADGPVLESDLDDNSQGSRLVIIWWSEMEPDTSRVFSVVEWEKHAKNYFL